MASSILKGRRWWAGAAAQGVIDVEGGDRNFSALRWWKHGWDGSGVPVVFMGPEGV